LGCGVGDGTSGVGGDGWIGGFAPGVGANVGGAWVGGGGCASESGVGDGTFGVGGGAWIGGFAPGVGAGLGYGGCTCPAAPVLVGCGACGNDACGDGLSPGDGGALGIDAGSGALVGGACRDDASVCGASGSGTGGALGVSAFGGGASGVGAGGLPGIGAESALEIGACTCPAAPVLVGGGCTGNGGARFGIGFFAPVSVGGCGGASESGVGDGTSGVGGDGWIAGFAPGVGAGLKCGGCTCPAAPVSVGGGGTGSGASGVGTSVGGAWVGGGGGASESGVGDGTFGFGGDGWIGGFAPGVGAGLKCGGCTGNGGVRFGIGFFTPVSVGGGGGGALGTCVGGGDGSSECTLAI
jgi:hypothetical protein